MPVPANTTAYDFTVQYVWPTSEPAPIKKTVRAAYFVENDSLTCLKDCGHEPVFAVPTSLLVSIERGVRHDDGR